jgi:hypothetical protein
MASGNPHPGQLMFFRHLEDLRHRIAPESRHPGTTHVELGNDECAGVSKKFRGYRQGSKGLPRVPKKSCLTFAFANTNKLVCGRKHPP